MIHGLEGCGCTNIGSYSTYVSKYDFKFSIAVETFILVRVKLFCRRATWEKIHVYNVNIKDLLKKRAAKESQFVVFTSRCRSVRVRLRDEGRVSPGWKRVGTSTTSRLLRQPGGGRWTLQNARSCESLTILSPFLRSLDRRTWSHRISSISRSHMLEYA